MKKVDLIFFSHNLINVSILAFHIFGVWPRKHSTLIHTVIDYSIKLLILAGWTITKSIITNILEDRSDICFLAIFSYFYFTKNSVTVLNVRSFNQLCKLVLKRSIIVPQIFSVKYLLSSV